MTDEWELPKRKPITDDTLEAAMLAEAMESVSVHEGQDGFWYALVDDVMLDYRYNSQEEAQEGGLSSLLMHYAEMDSNAVPKPQADPVDPYAWIGPHAARINKLYDGANAGTYDIRSMPSDLTRDQKNVFLTEQREDFRNALVELFGPYELDARETCWSVAQRYADAHWIAPRLNNKDFTGTVEQSKAVNLICWYRDMANVLNVAAKPRSSADGN